MIKLDICNQTSFENRKWFSVIGRKNLLRKGMNRMMKQNIKKLSLFLLCVMCIMAFACCATEPQDSGVPDSQSSTEASDESSSDSGTQGDENELPRVPY